MRPVQTLVLPPEGDLAFNENRRSLKLVLFDAEGNPLEIGGESGGGGVEWFELPSGGTKAFSIAGLDGDADKLYTLVGNLRNVGGNQQIGLRFNGDTSGSNHDYNGQRLALDGSSAAHIAMQADSIRFARIAGSGWVDFEAKIHADRPTYNGLQKLRTAHFKSLWNGHNATWGLEHVQGSGRYRSNAANLTSIEIATMGGDTMYGRVGLLRGA